MRLLSYANSFFRSLFRRREIDADLDDEVRSTVELLADQKIKEGMPPNEARRAARIELGGVEQVKEKVREARGAAWLDALWQDLRFGVRMLGKNPGFTAIAIITLALGIGANTAIFQLIDAVRLRTLPVRNPQTLAIIHVETNGWRHGIHANDYAEFTFPMWQQIRTRQKSFSTVAVWNETKLNLARGGEVDYATALWVSGEFFDTLGIQPMLGRLISEADDQTGCSGGADVSYEFWQRRYGGMPSVIGKELSLDGHSFPIVGVTSPSFHGVIVGDRFDVAVPLCTEPLIRGQYSRMSGPGVREKYWLAMIGRLKPGWSLARATAQLRSISPAVLEETIPPEFDASNVKDYLECRLEAQPAANGFSELRSDTSTALWLLLGLSGLVLLIACANLANLMLARGSVREREIAVRSALGASRGRLVRQLLSETALLAITGTILGAVLAYALSTFLVAFMSTPDNPIFLDIPTDWRVLCFSAGLAVVTTILFGAAPAAKTGNVGPAAALKGGARGIGASRDRFRLQRTLVVTQFALSIVLLSGALLFARSLRNLLTLNLGFQQNGVLIANVDFTRLNLPVERRYAFDRDLIERIRAVPGVAAAAEAEVTPVSGEAWANEVLGKDSDRVVGRAWTNWIGPGYFPAMRTPMLSGRDFDSNDTAISPRVLIVNEEFVKKFLDGAEDAVGKQVRFEGAHGKPKPPYTVVGVVSDAVYFDLHQPMLALAYVPLLQEKEPDTTVSLLIRSTEGSAGLSNSVKDAIMGLAPEINIEFRVLSVQIGESLVQDKLMATLCGFFGVLAVLLAAVGLYGVISYTATQRTNEIAVRMALGAQPHDIIRLILSGVTKLIGIGVALGVALTLAAGNAAAALLFDLKPHDPATLAVAIIILTVIGLTAGFVPARRAVRLDPIQALRQE